jgi:hypothetical protein
MILLSSFYFHYQREREEEGKKYQKKKENKWIFPSTWEMLNKIAFISLSWFAEVFSNTTKRETSTIKTKKIVKFYTQSFMNLM